MTRLPRAWLLDLRASYGMWMPPRKRRFLQRSRGFRAREHVLAFGSEDNVGNLGFKVLDIIVDAAPPRISGLAPAQGRCSEME